MFRSVATKCRACHTIDQDGYVYKVGKDDPLPGGETECQACHQTGQLIAIEVDGPAYADTRTAWGDSHWQRWDYGLGCYTTSKTHRDQIMRSLGAREGYANG